MFDGQSSGIAANKVLDFQSLSQIVKNIRLSLPEERIVLTTGCFDIIHVGHLRYLKLSRNQGDFLIVGVNSDTSVKTLKGENRPLFPENERAELVSAFECVSIVCLFDDNISLIEAVKPDIFVMSTTSTNSQTPDKRTTEKDLVISYRGEVKIFGSMYDSSTSEMISRFTKFPPQ